MGLIVPVENGQTPPPDVARAIGLMKAAGFDGVAEYRKEPVEYPGGAYTLETVTFERWDKAVRETYMADLFAKWPMITIVEAGRIGLLVPNPNKKPVGA
jgi:hypothetical protein